MEIISKSFGLEGGSSPKLVKRSNSARLVSESISSECARVASYERLSESIRMSSRRDINYSNEKRKAVGFISKFFSLKRNAGCLDQTTREGKSGAREEKKNKKKKWSSWLPDHERRWPVQGWRWEWTHISESRRVARIGTKRIRRKVESH